MSIFFISLFHFYLMDAYVPSSRMEDELGQGLLTVTLCFLFNGLEEHLDVAGTQENVLNEGLIKLQEQPDSS